MRAAIFIILLFCSHALFAQQQATVSQYMFNEFVINPAYAGTHEMLSASAHIRFQNVGLEGAPPVIFRVREENVFRRALYSARRKCFPPERFDFSTNDL